MKKKVLPYALKLIFVLLIGGSLLYLYAAAPTAEEKKQFIEIEEEIGDGEMVTKKIPAVEDPCVLKGSAKEEAKKFVIQYRIKPKSYQYQEAKSIIKEINAKKFDEIEHLSTIIELSLYNWACGKEYKLHNTRSQGIYFFKKDKGQGIFIGIKADGYLPTEGVRKGNASLALDKRGRMGDTYYLQVVITKLNPEPNEKYGTELNEEAKKILNEIVNFSYTWGLDYYNTLIEEVAKKTKK